MRTIEVSGKYSGKRVDRILWDSFPHMPSGALFKAFRKKDVKVNGLRVKEDHIAVEGDRIDVYIVDEILLGTPRNSDFRLNSGFSVVYEDNSLLIVNKEQGIPVHPDREQSDNTLIDRVQAYLEQKGEYDPSNPSHFPPSLCHRLDRNTGGLLIIAKNSESLKLLLEKIKSKEIRKYYLCLVQGQMPKARDELKAYLEKDEKKSRVYIHPEPSRNSQEIITRYRVLSAEGETSRLEVELVTGRTHQIRAHLAYMGHPIVGDGKYGSNSFNRSMKSKYQALWAYKLVFDFKTGAGPLNYLKGKKFQVEPGF